MPIEGTVQENSQETYDAYEGAFTLLESGDVTKAAGRRESSRRGDHRLPPGVPGLARRDCVLSPSGDGGARCAVTRVAAAPSPAACAPTSPVVGAGSAVVPGHP